VDTILAALLNLGIGGAMAAAVVYFLYSLTTSIIPGLIAKQDKEIAWCHDQIVQQRAEFLIALQRNQEKWETAVEKICEEIAELRDALHEPLVAAERKRRHPQGIIVSSGGGSSSISSSISEGGEKT
jgi:hypothetical protein